MVLGLLLATIIPVALSSPTVLRSDESGVVVRWETATLQLVATGVGEVRVEMEDADYPSIPGEYDLPFKTIRVGLPQSGGFRAAVRPGPTRTFHGVVPAAAVAVSSGERPLASRVPHSRDRGDSPLEVGPVEEMRGVRFVEIKLHPCLYEETARRLTVHDWLEVEILFDSRPDGTRLPDRMDDIISRMLVNGPLAVDWKIPTVSRRESFFDRSTHWVKLTITETGIHGVSGRDLAAAGVPIAGIDPRTLALYAMGEYSQNGPYPDTMVPVALHLEGDNEGRLDPDDRVVFFARAAEHWTNRCSSWVENLYTGQAAYWLTWGLEPGLRMPVGLGPDTAGTEPVRNGRWRVHQEENNECPARSGLLWIWRTLLKDSYRPSISYDIKLKAQTPVRLERVSGRFFATTNNNELILALNGAPLDTLRFNAATATQPYRFDLAASVPLMARDNILRLELLGDGTRRVMLDYLEFDVLRRLSLADGQCRFLHDDTGAFRFLVRDASGPVMALDVTDPYLPRLADGVAFDGGEAVFSRLVTRPAEFCIADARTLLSPTAVELRRPGMLRAAPAVDYWIVTPDEFSPAARRLARYRSGNIAWLPDARVEVATLEDIYDDYAFGVEEPGAIKAFFADKRPVYGLLVGDATYDYRNHLGLRTAPGVPSWQVGYGLDPSGISGRDAYALDAWYADSRGAGSSPEVILGRVTARSGTELSSFVSKLIDYETGPAELWNRRYLLLADDEWSGEPGRPDPIGFRHIEQCEAMAALPGGTMDPVKVYLTEHPFAGPKNKPGARAEFLRELQAGALVFVFFGHGDAFDLCHESVFNIVQVPDVTNARRMPVSYFGSCSVGRFDDTRTECIAEELVRKPDGGSIVTIGATKATTSGSNTVFARNLLMPLFGNPDSTVGTAFFLAWPTDRLYHLFGDPATRLRRVSTWPEQLMVRPDTLRPAGTFHGRALLDRTEGHCQWRLSGPLRARTYTSVRGTANYVLPGVTLARGNVSVRSGRLDFDGRFPLGIPLDTVRLNDGMYVPLPHTARLAGVVDGDGDGLGLLGDMLTWNREPAPADDSTGPSVRFFRDGGELRDGDFVPSAFELEGVVFDPSGILVSPVPGSTPEFFTSNRSSVVDLADRLVFDDSLVTTARFRLPVRLTGGADTLWTLVSDNLLNRTLYGIAVRPLSGTEPLRLDSLLVYPNPSAGPAIFTFNLNRPADVRVRIYTLSGRLVRDLGEWPAGYGYNQLDWDGRDAHGNRLANGVYLVSVTARAPGVEGYEMVRVRDRLLVLH